ncbi:MAG: AAA family ATPase [Clostridia bacterium]|nr:AAA family ATPase [Clostridia bacterium]
MKTKKFLVLALIILAILLGIVLILLTQNKDIKYMPYRNFSNRLASGDVESAQIESKKVLFWLKSQSGDYFTDNPKNDNFRENLLINDVQIKESFDDEDMAFAFDIIFYAIFFFVMGFALYKFSSLFGATKFKVIHKNNTKFTDICGMEEIKKDMTKTVDLLKNPDKYKEKGIRPPKGIILEGPPGNGKTLFAKALAGEANINFIPTKGADFQSAMMSIGPHKIKSVFKKAKRHKPCIIFIDEFDGIGERRNYTGTGIDKENNRIITAMLNEMDGFENEDGVLVIGATNSYGSLDAALIRPGRFDKKYNIVNPDKETIIELIKMYTKGKKLASNINIDSLAKCFNGLSCSAVETLLNESAMEAQIAGREEIVLEDVIKAGRKTNIIKINRI